MKSLRKIMVLLLALAMMFTVSCTKETTTSEAEPTKTTQKETGVETETKEEVPFDPMAKYEPGIEVTTIKIIPDGLQFAEGEDFENNIWTRAYEEELGITMKYLWTVPTAQGEQKMNIAIASNDLPDIIPTSLLQFSQLVESGVAADLTEVIEDYSTLFTKEMYEADSYVALQQATVNERIMAIPLISGNIDNGAMLWIRTDWLKALGLEAPKTIDDVVNIAKIFKEQDPNQSGEDDTIGLAFNKDFVAGGFADLIGFFEGHGAYVNGWVDDGNGSVVYGGIQPEVKIALEKLSTMRANGLIDPEFSVKDGGKIAELTSAENTGMVYGMHWIPFWPLNTTIDNNPEADWLPYAIPTIDGAPTKTMINGSAGTMFVVNKKFEYPEAAVKLFNYCYQKDCALSEDFDEEFHADNERKYNRYQYAALSGFYPQQNLFIYKGVKDEVENGIISENAWVTDNVKQNKDYLAGDNTFWSAYAWSGTNGAFSIIDYYNENDLFLVNGYVMADTPTMIEKMATLNDMQLQVYTKIIMGTEDSTAFDKFVDDWKNLGGNDITAEVNSTK